MLISNSIYYFRISVLLTLCFNEHAAGRNIFLKSENCRLAHDLPTRKDLNVYLNSLERIINFSYKFKTELDLNFSFGLFLVNVHLKPFINDLYLPIPLRKHLISLLDRNDKILKFLDDKQDKKNRVNYMISSFYKNDTSWSRRLKKLKSNLPQEQSKVTYRDLKLFYLDWRGYNEKVNDIDRWVPSPQQSDKCLASLAENEDYPSSRKCRVPENCYKMLLAGTNFGYALTHRLLFLLFAFYGRRCTIFSASQDGMMRHRLCEMIYTEADYIAHNRYANTDTTLDLMLEQIALCSLNGHADFLRRSWFTNLLRYQMPQGCFASHQPSTSNKQNYTTFDQQLNNPKDKEKESWKNEIKHVTAVAASSIAAAVRLILESFDGPKCNRYYVYLLRK